MSIWGKIIGGTAGFALGGPIGAILGVIAGGMGSLQATEAIKEILGIGESLAGRFLIYDALETSFHTIKLPHNPNCPLCGDKPSINDVEI